MPGSTVASEAILTSETRMPSIITPTIDHTPDSSVQRSSDPTHRGAGGRREASSIASMNTMSRAGATMMKRATRTEVTFSP